MLREEKLNSLRSEIESKKTHKEELHKNKTFLSALEWRFEFPEVLDDKGVFVGFDIIIANPPYMRVQQIEETQPLQKSDYERNYSTARGSYDLANLFFELAVSLSSKTGNNNIFIFPHKLFNSENGAALREYLINNRAIKHISHFGANQVFDKVLTYTCIALFNSKPCDSYKFKQFPLGSDFRNELSNDALYTNLTYDQLTDASNLYGNNQWIFFDQPASYEAFAKMFKATRPLSSIMNVFVGLQTSHDTLYVVHKVNESKSHYKILVNPDKKDREPPIPTKEFKVEKELFRPFLLGKDVHRYETLETDRLVFFPYKVDNKAELVRMDDLKKEYPLTHAFVQNYEKPFSAREKGKAKKLDEWYAYIYPKNLTKFNQDKLTCMEICSRHPNVTTDCEGIYHATTLYSLVKLPGVKESYKFFAAVLNSSLFWWFLKLTGDTLQGDARRMKTNYLEPFPIPESVSKNSEKRIVNLVTKIIDVKKETKTSDDIPKLEAEIDSAIYSLYGFNDKDIEAVKRALNPNVIMLAVRNNC